MTLNASGPLSLGGATTGQSINLELGVSATALASINATNFRTLAGVPSGAISISNFYGKSNTVGWIATVGFYDSGTGIASAGGVTQDLIIRGFAVADDGTVAIGIAETDGSSYGTRYLTKAGADIASYASGGPFIQVRTGQLVGGTYFIQSQPLSSSPIAWVANSASSPTSFSRSLTSLTQGTFGGFSADSSGAFNSNPFVLDSNNDIYAVFRVTKNKASPNVHFVKIAAGGTITQRNAGANAYVNSLALYKLSNGSLICFTNMASTTTGDIIYSQLNTTTLNATPSYRFTRTGTWPYAASASAVDYGNNVIFSLMNISGTDTRIARINATPSNTHVMKIGITSGDGQFTAAGIGMAVYGGYLYCVMPFSGGGFHLVVLNAADLTLAWAKKVSQTYFVLGMCRGCSVYANANGLFIGVSGNTTYYSYVMQFPLANTLANASYAVTGGTMTISSLTPTMTAQATWSVTSTSANNDPFSGSTSVAMNTPATFTNTFALNKLNI